MSEQSRTTQKKPEKKTQEENARTTQKPQVHYNTTVAVLNFFLLQICLQTQRWATADDIIINFIYINSLLFVSYTKYILGLLKLLFNYQLTSVVTPNDLF